jgi:hypothetical protein
MLSQSQSRNSLKPFLNHAGETTAEQIEKNQAAIELLKKWMDEEIPAPEQLERQSYLAALKVEIDNHRCAGSKLYSNE